MTRPANQPLERADFDAVIFDLDGVVTRTSTLHARAWADALGALLERLAERGAGEFAPFDLRADYVNYLDGRPRLAGAAAFLRARGVDLPMGEPDAEPGFDSIEAVANLKNELFQSRIERDGVEVFEDAVRRLKEWRALGMRTAIASSSRNSEQVLRAAGLLEFFDVRCDGRDLDAAGLPGKPAPDLFLETARRLKTAPGRSVVIEDAAAGVRAARAGGFGLIIGIDRSPSGEEGVDLKGDGADIVVSTLAELPAATSTPHGSDA